jgi:S1-C subfamily serine protease
MSEQRRFLVVRSTIFMLSLNVTTVIFLFAVLSAQERTWTSSDGNYSVEAEFVEFKDGNVSLRKTDGDLIKVPLSRLSAENQAYVVERSTNDDTLSTTTDVSSPRKWARTFTQLVQTSNLLRTAPEVVRLYSTFLEDESITDADRKAAEKQLLVWQGRAEQQMVRIGFRWLTSDEANNQRHQAQQLAAEALRLIEVGQFDAAIDKCLQASKTDENAILADFLLGLGYAFFECNSEHANRHFAECVRRDPQHISALNNLALTAVRLENYDQALANWQTAMELAPAAPEVIQNIGRLLHLSTQGSVRMRTGTERRFRDLYAAAAVSAGPKEFNSRTGWLYMGYYPSLDAQPLEDKKPAQSSKQSKTDPITIGSGTGFVVYPGYVLTNRHVVKSGTRLLVVPPEDKSQTLPASVVGETEGYDDDLAVIRCKQLASPPLAFIKGDLAPRGTEIMILGFPGISVGKTPSLVSTRGIVSGLPDESFDSYKLDAIANPGNSGGPICDDTGSVLGILFAHTIPLAMNYTLGVPHSRALPLLKKSIPDFQQPPPNLETKKWHEIDDLVSRSTVLIWIQGNAYDFGITESAKSKQRARTQVLEDFWCMTCNGRTTVPCPSRGCIKGLVSDSRMVLKAVDPRTGFEVYAKEFYRVACKVCSGKGVVRCTNCRNGIDRSLL